MVGRHVFRREIDVIILTPDDADIAPRVREVFQIGPRLRRRKTRASRTFGLRRSFGLHPLSGPQAQLCSFHNVARHPRRAHLLHGRFGLAPAAVARETYHQTRPGVRSAPFVGSRFGDFGEGKGRRHRELQRLLHFT